MSWRSVPEYLKAQSSNSSWSDRCHTRERLKRCSIRSKRLASNFCSTAASRREYGFDEGTNLSGRTSGRNRLCVSLFRLHGDISSWSSPKRLHDAVISRLIGVLPLRVSVRLPLFACKHAGWIPSRSGMQRRKPRQIRSRVAWQSR